MKSDSIYMRTMTDINHTLTKLNIEAHDDKQLIELGQTYSIQQETYRLRAQNYSQLHKHEVRQKQRNTQNNDFDFRKKKRQQKRILCNIINYIKVNHVYIQIHQFFCNENSYNM